jgi:hypothetical protein
VLKVTVPDVPMPGCEKLAVSPVGKPLALTVIEPVFPSVRETVRPVLTGVASWRAINVELVALRVIASTAFSVVVRTAELVAVPSLAVIVMELVPGVMLEELLRNMVPKELAPGWVNVTVTPAGTPLAERVMAFVLPAEREAVAMMLETVPSAGRVINDGLSERLTLSGTEEEFDAEPQPHNGNKMVTRAAKRVRRDAIK